MNCDYLKDSFERYFSFWFAHFANGGTRNLVYLDEKEFYVKTVDIAEKHGKVDEDWTLSEKIKNLIEAH